jgi:predicted  nucleic acid-binding Zn-ribbon protein
MGVQKNQTLKQLKTQQSKLIGVVDALKIEISTLQKEFSAKTKAVDELQKKIDRLEHPVEVTISEHAILRYFERIESVEMDKIKENILTEKVKKLIDELGPNGTYPT